MNFRDTDVNVTNFSTSRFTFQPVILLGAARSGTNMLRDSLTQLPGVATWPCDEINAIWRYRNSAFPSDELPAQAATCRVQRYIRAAFCRLAKRSSARWVVEKTCANSLRVDFVRAVLPESKFIVLLRDGRDVVASAMKRWTAPLDYLYTLRKARFVPPPEIPYYAVRFARLRLQRLRSPERRLSSWGPRFVNIDDWVASCSLAEVCAHQWSECVLKAAESIAQLPVSTHCAVRYETLVSNPSQELTRIASFLGVPATAEQLSRIAESISNRSVAKWRSDSSIDAVASVESLIETTSRRLHRILPQAAHAMEAAA